MLICPLVVRHDGLYMKEHLDNRKYFENLKVLINKTQALINLWLWYKTYFAKVIYFIKLISLATLNKYSVYS